MLLLFTDFGLAGPYTGQVKAVLAREAPGLPAIDLMADAPAFDPRAAAHLLAALVDTCPDDAVFLCVVDPGVGSARRPLILNVGRRWFVGPDNGLLELVGRRAGASAAWWEITWRPRRLSTSFHGRDLFAPVAARLARGGIPDAIARPLGGAPISSGPDDLAAVVYIDAYGNVMTGLRGDRIDRAARLRVDGGEVGFARTFSDVPPAAPFWYVNSIGLVELAVNRGRADRDLGLALGSVVGMVA